jgi:two-component system CheB/CheR fusion protein
VGASAGGLEAFTLLLRGLPPSPGIAIIFVQHLAPQHESALVPLLSAQTALPVVQAKEGMRVRSNRVYVIPPNVQMAINGNELHLRPRPDDRSQYTPIDSFLGSLASAAGPRAIGVILSGTASDGAVGVHDIKSAGGLTIAQTPSSAKYDGMPRAAIETGMVDLILPPDIIGGRLGYLAQHPSMRSLDKNSQELPVAERELKELFDLLRTATGVDFRHYKLPTIKRRLFRRMALHRLNTVKEYLRLLHQDATETRNLYHDLLIHVTSFFREPESFEALAREVFPALVEKRPAESPIRVWVSGCSTGEEAYSIAIALTEFLRDHADIRIQIFATDVSEAAIEQARTGSYPLRIEADVSAERLRRFFTRHEGSYRVSKMIRDLCVFARQDLAKDPPFSRLDLILCRNVLIYMDLPLQKKLLSIFHYALNPNGFLVLGQAETVGAHGTLFSLVDKKFRVHRKKTASVAPLMSFPLDYSLPGVGSHKRPAVETGDSERLLLGEVARTLVDRYAPPGVVVDGDMQIVQFRGQTGTFLEPAPGEASLNLLKMAREGLLYGIRTTIHAARQSRAPVHKDGLHVRTGQGWMPVSIDVIPISAAGRHYYVVLFDAQSGRSLRQAPASKASKGRKISDGEEGRHTGVLRRELAASREYLQSIIQELEAANEELQSANEEILSSNEELQSTNEELDTAKEELQSTNEELNTVNEEMHGRNEELTRVNSDLLNLLGSVQIAIVIVDADLRIRRFTPMAEKVLNLISSDLERSIAHINPNIGGVNLEELITSCIDTIVPVEREVQDREGHWYALRIRPYRSLDNKIDGAVIALFDIDAPKRFEEAARIASAFVEAVIHASSDPMAVIDEKLRVKAVNQRFLRMFSSLADDIRGHSLQEIMKPGPGIDQLEALPIEASGGAESTIELQAAAAPHQTVRVSAQVFQGYERSTNRMVLLTARQPAADNG